MPTSNPNETRSQQVFKAADPTTQELIKELLGEERKVIHMKKKQEIHVKFTDLIKRNVK